MGINKLDKVFRDKLSLHTSPPGAEAWGQLESMLDGKRKKVIFWYYKAAAAVAILLISSIVTYNMYVNVDDSQLTDTYASDVQTTKDQNISEQSNNDLAVSSNNSELTNEQVNNSESNEIETEVLQETEVREQLLATNSDDNVIESKANQETADPDVQDTEVELIPQLAKMDESILVDDNLIAQVDDSTNPESSFQNDEIPVAVKTNNSRTVKITFKTKPKKKLDRKVVIVAKIDTTRRKRPDFMDIIRFPGNLLADVRDAKDDLFNQKTDLERSKTQNSK